MIKNIIFCLFVVHLFSLTCYAAEEARCLRRKRVWVEEKCDESSRRKIKRTRREKRAAFIAKFSFPPYRLNPECLKSQIIEWGDSAAASDASADASEEDICHNPNQLTTRIFFNDINLLEREMWVTDGIDYGLVCDELRRLLNIVEHGVYLGGGNKAAYKGLCKIADQLKIESVERKLDLDVPKVSPEMFGTC